MAQLTARVATVAAVLIEAASLTPAADTDSAAEAAWLAIKSQLT